MLRVELVQYLERQPSVSYNSSQAHQGVSDRLQILGTCHITLFFLLLHGGKYNVQIQQVVQIEPLTAKSKKFSPEKIIPAEPERSLSF
jgi:hypothetical protein